MGQNGWSTGQQMADDASVGGKFLSLKDDGDKCVIAFLGEPHSRLVFWDTKSEQYIDADSDEGKAYADNHADKKPSFRASINCYVLKTGNGDNMKEDERVAMFENGVTWFNDLVKCKTKYGLGIWTFEMERKGKAKDPKTTYSVLPDKKIDDVPGLTEKIAKAELHDLANPNASSDNEKKGASSSSNGAITDVQSKELIAGLKALDRSELDSFLTKFDIKRVKELSGAKLEDAQKWLAEKSGNAPEPEGEIDPFE